MSFPEVGTLLDFDQSAGVAAFDTLSAMLTHERCGRHLYRSVEGRSLNPMLKALPDSTDREQIAEFLDQQAARYPGATAEDARVWADVAHVIFNSKEFIFVR